MNETKPIINIAGQKVAMGPLRQDLMDSYDRWFNETAAAFTYYAGDLRPDTREDTSARYERLKNEVSFTIYEKASLRPIGVCNLLEVNHFNRAAMFGILIGEPDARGRGYGTEATRLTLDWAFNAMGLHNVALTVFSFNVRGIRAYEKAGFKVFGRRREAKRVGGQAYDVVYMDALATDFAGSVLSKYLPAL